LDENADIQFWPIASVACHSDETRAKHVLASFCQACLHPETTMPSGDAAAATTTTMLYRPASILLETQEDADHPTVVTFFGMMGYPAESIGVLDESMQAWLRADLANDDAKEDQFEEPGGQNCANNKCAVCGINGGESTNLVWMLRVHAYGYTSYDFILIIDNDNDNDNRQTMQVPPHWSTAPMAVAKCTTIADRTAKRPMGNRTSKSRTPRPRPAATPRRTRKRPAATRRERRTRRERTRERTRARTGRRPHGAKAMIRR
jgi:hypothetical protein